MGMIYCMTLRTASLLINLLCNTIVPVIENIATKFRIGGCFCPDNSLSPEIELRGRSKRRKLKNGEVAKHHREGKEVKRIKLLLDITVKENGGVEPEVEIRERARYVDDSEVKQEGIIVRLLNLPSSTVLYFTSKLRKWAHDLDDLENESCAKCVNNRIKKSPKRRITRSNYRKIIPFFPFNLLGFSNYSAFQMPSLTHCQMGEDETNNLNVSTVSGRCKRPRTSSVSSIGSDISLISSLPTTTNRWRLGDTCPEYLEGTVQGGHDEVDSDESADTTKQVTSSSSNETHSESQQSNGKVGKKNKKNENRSANGDDASFKELLEELDEASNENYNSDEDPDYVPPENDNSTTESSNYNTDSISEESFLSASKIEDNSGTANHASITSAVEASVENSNRKSISSLPISEYSQNGHNNQNGHHHEVCEDDYKTPEEEEHETFAST